MESHDWNELASFLAQRALQTASLPDRGVFKIEFLNKALPIAGLYGKDHYAKDDRARQEVEWVRQQLSAADLDELGFGLSPDGEAWALLVKADPRQRCRSRAGIAFQKEMLEMALEEILQKAWQKAWADSSSVAAF